MRSLVAPSERAVLDTRTGQLNEHSSLLVVSSILFTRDPDSWLVRTYPPSMSALDFLPS